MVYNFCNLFLVLKGVRENGRLKKVLPHFNTVQRWEDIISV